MKEKSIPASNNEKSILIGNGININFGGAAYSNNFIIQRIIFNARAGKYDTLFNHEINGDEIVKIFKDLAEWANGIRSGKYDNIIMPEDERALKSFKTRYNKKIENSTLFH